jgi:hypothetical protein
MQRLRVANIAERLQSSFARLERYIAEARPERRHAARRLSRMDGADSQKSPGGRGIRTPGEACLEVLFDFAAGDEAVPEPAGTPVERWRDGHGSKLAFSMPPEMAQAKIRPAALHSEIFTMHRLEQLPLLSARQHHCEAALPPMRVCPACRSG